MHKTISLGLANKILDLYELRQIKSNEEMVIVRQVSEEKTFKFESTMDEVQVYDAYGIITAYIAQNILYVPSGHLRDLLNEFSNVVTTHKLKKLPYDTWRTLLRMADIEPQGLYLMNFLEGSETKLAILSVSTNLCRIMSGSDGFTIFTNSDCVEYEMPFKGILKKFNITEEDNTMSTSYSNATCDSTERCAQSSPTKIKTFGRFSAPNIDFGVVNNDSVVVSPYGLAIRSGNQFFAYDAKENKTVDVTGFTFDFPNMIYKMPVSIKDVKTGDMIVHQRKPMYVTDLRDGKVEAIDIMASEEKTIIPVSNVFGFNFVTKIVSLVNLSGMQPSADNPFGNIMPLMMMSSIMDGDTNNSNIGEMLMLSAMMGNGSNPFANLFNGGTDSNS